MKKTLTTAVAVLSCLAVASCGSTPAERVTVDPSSAVVASSYSGGADRSKERTTRPMSAPVVSRDFVRAYWADNVKVWEAYLGDRWGVAPRVTWQRGVRESARSWLVTLVVSARHRRAVAKWRLALPLEKLLADGEGIVVDQGDGRLRPANQQAKRFEGLPKLAASKNRPMALLGAAVTLAEDGTHLEAFILTVDKGDASDVANAGDQIVPMLRGLSWQREHDTPGGSVLLSLDPAVRVTTAKNTSIPLLEFARQLRAAPFRRVVLSWRAAPTDLDGLLAAPIVSIHVLPR